MKVWTSVTEIEASAEELRQSNILADSFSNLLRGSLQPILYKNSVPFFDDDEGEEEPKK